MARLIIIFIFLSLPNLSVANLGNCYGHFRNGQLPAFIDAAEKLPSESRRPSNKVQKKLVNYILERLLSETKSYVLGDLYLQYPKEYEEGFFTPALVKREDLLRRIDLNIDYLKTLASLVTEPGNRNPVTNIQSHLLDFLGEARRMTDEELMNSIGITEVELPSARVFLDFFEVDQPALIQFFNYYVELELRQLEYLRFSAKWGLISSKINGRIIESAPRLLQPLAAIMAALVILPSTGVMPGLIPNINHVWGMSLAGGTIFSGILGPAVISVVSKSVRSGLLTPMARISKRIQYIRARKGVRALARETWAQLDSLQTQLEFKTTTYKEVSDRIKEVDRLIGQESVVESIKAMEKLHFYVSDYYLDKASESNHPWVQNYDLQQRALSLLSSGQRSVLFSVRDQMKFDAVIQYFESQKQSLDELASLLETLRSRYDRILKGLEEDSKREMERDAIRGAIKQLEFIKDQNDRLGLSFTEQIEVIKHLSSLGDRSE